MKKTTKIFIIALVMAISLAFAIPTFAYSENDSNETESETAESEVYTDNIQNDTGFFESLYSAFASSSSEILSALAFIGSLIIMLCYKKGLLPIVTDGLQALKSGIKAINEKSDSFNEHAINLCDSIDGRLERAEKLTEAALKSAESVEEQMSEIHKSNRENEKLKIILCAQIDMLYEIFMSASLPQYLKDNVGEKIGAMKSALGKEEYDDTLA